MESFPFDMLKLIGEKRCGAAFGQLVQSCHQRIGPYDPKHVEPAQGIDGHQALSRTESFGGFWLSGGGGHFLGWLPMILLRSGGSFKSKSEIRTA